MESDAHTPLEEALAEYLLLVDSGQAVNRQAFIAAHPEVADQLQAYFADSDAMGSMLADTAAGEAAVPTESKPAGPPTVEDYEILEELGRGGMGVVYKARHKRLGSLVAMKVMGSQWLDDPQAVARFQREMLAVGRLQHKHVVRARDARQTGGTLILITEFVDGVDLAALVRTRGPLPVATCCSMIRQAALGLQCIHEQGLVHRDIKPSNLILTTGKEPSASAGKGGRIIKILDLGLARFRREHSMVQGGTATGQALGTLDYMAPEQITDSRSVDIRADIYSLGCTLYKLLTGRAPFADAQHGNAVAKMRGHLREQPPPIRELRPEVPPSLAALIQQMMAKDPADRPPTPDQVAGALAPFAGRSPAGASSTTPEPQRQEPSPVEPGTPDAPADSLDRPSQPVAEDVPDPIVVQCVCGKRIRAKNELAGKRVKCPSCSQPLTVPSPRRQSTPPPDDPLGLGDLASLEQLAPSSADSLASALSGGRPISKAVFGGKQARTGGGISRRVALALGAAGGAVALVVIVVAVMWFSGGSEKTPDDSASVAEMPTAGTSGEPSASKPSVKPPSDLPTAPVGPPASSSTATVEAKMPRAVTHLPDWLAEDAPFDVREFWITLPSAENAAALYLDALYEFSPHLESCFPAEHRAQRTPAVKARYERSRQLQIQWNKPNEPKDTPVRDAVLAEFDIGFQKLAAAQRRPKCVFDYAVDTPSMFTLLLGARESVRVAELRVERDIERGDFAAAMDTIGILLRLSRDLRPRAPRLMQTVGDILDAVALSNLIVRVLKSPLLTTRDCDELLRLLLEHEAELQRLDPYLTGLKGDYVRYRLLVRDIQERTGEFADSRFANAFDESNASRGEAVVAAIGLSDVGTALDQGSQAVFKRRHGVIIDAVLTAMKPSDYELEDREFKELYEGYAAMSQKSYSERLAAVGQLRKGRAWQVTAVPPETLRNIPANKKDEKNEAAMMEWMTGAIAAGKTSGRFFSSWIHPNGAENRMAMRFDQAAIDCHSRTQLQGAKALVALRRWYTAHDHPPPDFSALCSDAGLAELPRDFFVEGPLRMVTFQADTAIQHRFGKVPKASAGETIIYSVGPDGVDDQALIEGSESRNGDILFRLEKPQSQFPSQLKQAPASHPEGKPHEPAATPAAAPGPTPPWNLPAGSPPPAIAPFDAAQAKQHQAAWAKYLDVPVEFENSIGMKFVLIPPGEFVMGSTEAEVAKLLEEGKSTNQVSWYIERLPGEAPKHRVRITKPFYSAASEVTQAQYERVMGNNPSKFKEDTTCPVEMVNWDDASAFCRKLGELPEERSRQRAYRLPTEAEWEYSCRAGTTTTWYSGDDESGLKEIGWFSSNAGGKTHPVGEKWPNAWGLYDMHGNVWEWCQDWWALDYYGVSPLDDPAGPAGGSFRGHRGGGWKHVASHGRASHRNWSGPGNRHEDLGFRLAKAVSWPASGAASPQKTVAASPQPTPTPKPSVSPPVPKPATSAGKPPTESQYELRREPPDDEAFRRVMTEAQQYLSRFQNRLAVVRVRLEDPGLEPECTLCSVGAILPSRPSGNGYGALQRVRSGDDVVVGATPGTAVDSSPSALGIGTLLHYSATIPLDFREGEVVYAGEILLKRVPPQAMGQLVVNLRPEAGLSVEGGTIRVSRDGFHLGTDFRMTDGSRFAMAVAAGTFSVQSGDTELFQGPELTGIRVSPGETTQVDLAACYPRVVEIDWRARNRTTSGRWKRGTARLTSGAYWRPPRDWMMPNWHLRVSPWDGSTLMMWARSSGGIHRLPDNTLDRIDAAEIKAESTLLQGPPSYSQQIATGAVYGTGSTADDEQVECAFKVQSIAPVREQAEDTEE